MVPAPKASPDSSPASFLRIAGHPLRWRLLSELARSDRRVSELTVLLDQPQSLISYHLSQLRAEQLLTIRRSSSDGRDTYYSLDLARCGELLAATGTALHPGLGTIPPVSPREQNVKRRSRPRLLFLCTGNSARSQIAEALVERLTDGEVEACSAGSHPKPVHPNAVRVMREHGIDLSDRQSKHLDQFAGQTFQHVITLCDRVREVCPEFPGHPNLVHWSIPDPAREGTTDKQTYPAFQRTANELATRIPYLLALVKRR